MNVTAFVRDYTKIRRAEGRGSDNPEFYRNLPDCPDEHPLAWQWRTHRRTFACFRDRALPGLALGSEIVDVGAARHFAPSWPRLQTEFDDLPLDDVCVDAVVFNASLHYSTDYARTLREALRLLRPGGSIVILETPVHDHESSGRRMMEERHAAFQARYGTRSDSVASIEYLTWERLRALEPELNITWNVIYPGYGVGWALRPWIAKWQRKREPSRFPILQAWKRWGQGFRPAAGLRPGDHSS